MSCRNCGCPECVEARAALPSLAGIQVRTAEWVPKGALFCHPTLLDPREGLEEQLRRCALITGLES
jgi:hypothetical protein